MRLAFSITTAIESDIILMDEWLSVGDSKFIIKANDRLNKIVNNSKLLVLASHDLNLINSLCNVKYNIVKGKII
jgi:lipopolysaccharide transport system ATP-binding protein